MCLSYRFRVIASYLLKVADLDPPNLHLALRWVAQFEFSRDLWQQRIDSMDYRVALIA